MTIDDEAAFDRLARKLRDFGFSCEVERRPASMMNATCVRLHHRAVGAAVSLDISDIEMSAAPEHAARRTLTSLASTAADLVRSELAAAVNGTPVREGKPDPFDGIEIVGVAAGPTGLTVRLMSPDGKVGRIMFSPESSWRIRDDLNRVFLVEAGA